MSWILVNQDGKRFMNEYEPYGHDTGHRYMDQYEATKNRFPNLPAYMLFDEDGRKMYPVAKAYINDPNIDCYEWSPDNLKEVSLGILKKANSLEELSNLMNVPTDTLQATIQEWNSLCKSNDDDEFGRPCQTRLPIQSPPYYFGQIWPIVSNTQGALIHNTKQEVLNTFDEVIPRLYVAGEIGSIWGFLYLSGGNLAECLISGQIAGNEVSELEALQLN
jgi:succinate dehydrogenase/fumarate reductase flavoprotein subunit